MGGILQSLHEVWYCQTMMAKEQWSVVGRSSDQGQLHRVGGAQESTWVCILSAMGNHRKESDLLGFKDIFLASE